MHSLRQWRETWVGGWWLCREGGRQDKCTGKEKEAFCGGVGEGCGSDMNGGRKGGGQLKIGVIGSSMQGITSNSVKTEADILGCKVRNAANSTVGAEYRMLA